MLIYVIILKTVLKAIFYVPDFTTRCHLFNIIKYLNQDYPQDLLYIQSYLMAIMIYRI